MARANPKAAAHVAVRPSELVTVKSGADLGFIKGGGGGGGGLTEGTNLLGRGVN